MFALGLAAHSTPVLPLQETVTAYVKDTRRAPAVAVALLTPEGVQIATAGNPGRQREVHAGTLFEIGSVTKVMTGILLAEMVADGTVSLGTTVGQLMPGDRRLDPQVAEITLRELATHTSGLPRLPETLEMHWRVVRHPANPYGGLKPDDIFDAVAALSADELGTRGRFAYSNLGPALLGRLLERAAGQPYESLMTERVLKPLGLLHTQFTREVLGDPRLARPHRGNLRPTQNWTLDAYNPAGGLSSNLAEMRRFLHAAMTARPDSPLGVSLAIHWSDEAGEWASGLGWAITRRDGETIIWHNGRTGGYYAFVGFLPERQRGLVLLSNASHDGDALAVSLLRGEYALPKPPRDWFSLGLTLFLVVLAPLAAHSYRAHALATLSGHAKVPAGRINLASASLYAAFILTLKWKVGAWAVVPELFWWAGASATAALLAASLPATARLPWLPAVPGWRLVLLLMGIGASALLLFWVAFQV
ncbi:MAG: beta-lactamase family protein [Truepera sp.]|nr:beta-lactamase family protein [Truepera sp.]